MGLILELLDPDVHSREDFCNEIPEIERFLKQRANKEHEQSISDTFVLVDDENRQKILGFFTLSPSSVILEDIPSDLSRKLAKYPAYGTVLLGRMGRDHNYTPKGFGSLIMKEAMKESLNRGTYYALEIHAKESEDDKLIKYYIGFGFIPLMRDKRHLIMPRKEIIKVIQKSAIVT